MVAMGQGEYTVEGDDPDGGGRRDPSASRSSAPRLRRVLNLVVPLGLVVGGGYLLWDGYRAGGIDGVEVPILRADTSDMRVRPENPGGMEVPFRDRVILLQTSTPPTVETVTLTRPEVPLPRDLDDENGVVLIGDLLNRGEEMVAEAILPRGTGAPELGVSYRESEMLDSLIAEMAEEPALSLPPLEALPGFAGDDPLAALIDETAEPLDAAPPPADVIQPAVATGGFAVQLATVGSLEDVTVEWRRQAGIFTGILDGAGLIEDEAQIRSGRYMRVLVGPFVQNDAQALCQRIRGAGGDCFVTELDRG